MKKLSERNFTSEYNIEQASDRVKIVAKLRQYSMTLSAILWLHRNTYVHHIALHWNVI